MVQTFAEFASSPYREAGISNKLTVRSTDCTHDPALNEPGVKMIKTDAPSAAPIPEILKHACSIVVAYLGKNHIAQSELPGMIRSVHGALGAVAGSTHVDGATSQKPAVPVRKSITPDYIVCLEDGKKLKMLKRYLRGKFKLTPDEYRTKWGLPADYPMVAPNYAALRSSFAKQIGLGRRRAPAAKPKRHKRG